MIGPVPSFLIFCSKTFLGISVVPIVPRQRQFEHASKPFNDLIAYVRETSEHETREVTGPFGDIVDYSINPSDGLSKQDKCVAIRMNGITKIETASAEMHAVAGENPRCDAPAYHFILSWPEHERPEHKQIFDAAEHALKALGLGSHQYVIAIHVNTDNIHCHVAVNRVNPVTFKSRHLEWSHKTLHLAARQSELKHGWTHDNGIYIVQRDGSGRKHIVFNPNHEAQRTRAHAHGELDEEVPLPTWHDADSLEWWLKATVSKELKRDLSALTNWHALHAWLSNYDITLSDTGGGGLRLRAQSPETGEEFDIAVSKGLRLLKRAELEERWGTFRKAYQFDAVVPDLSHQSPIELQEGIDDFFANSFDGGIPPEHILRAREYDGPPRHSGARPSPRSTNGGQAVDRHGSDLEHAPGGRKLNRDDAKRAERKEQRAAARADLRLRFSEYKKLVALDDTAEDGHRARLKQLLAERSAAVRAIRKKANGAKATVGKGVAVPDRLRAVIELDTLAVRQTLQVEAEFRQKHLAVLATRLPTLAWREWLHEQAKLGDQAALSALRGIVYQARRDAVRQAKGLPGMEREQGAEERFADREEQFRRAMERLLEEEKKETAIRAAQSNMMRPYEADALLARYAGMQWTITGNGNIKYSDHAGKHLFTDRGNRLTFDRVYVTDNEIGLALVHARQKFGSELTLTGNDLVFTQRMARVADDIGITILNPELQEMLRQHRINRTLQSVVASAGKRAEAQQLNHTTQDSLNGTGVTPLVQAPVSRDLLVQQEGSPAETMVELPDQRDAPDIRLRARVLAIDPQAKFVAVDPTDNKKSFHGIVVAVLEDGRAFAQHIGRGVYALHPCPAPAEHGTAAIEVKYAAGIPVTKFSPGKKGPGRGD